MRAAIGCLYNCNDRMASAPISTTSTITRLQLLELPAVVTICNANFVTVSSLKAVGLLEGIEGPYEFTRTDKAKD